LSTYEQPWDEAAREGVVPNELSLEKGSTVAGDETAREVADINWPALLCAKLRKSGEGGLYSHRTPL
jgi:hypothetical protein